MRALARTSASRIPWVVLKNELNRSLGATKRRMSSAHRFSCAEQMHCVKSSPWLRASIARARSLIQATRRSVASMTSMGIGALRNRRSK